MTTEHSTSTSGKKMFEEEMVKWGSNTKLHFLHKLLTRNLKTWSVFQTLLSRTMLQASEIGGLFRPPEQTQNSFITRRCYGKRNTDKVKPCERRKKSPEKKKNQNKPWFNPSTVCFTINLSHLTPKHWASLLEVVSHLVAASSFVSGEISFFLSFWIAAENHKQPEVSSGLFLKFVTFYFDLSLRA